MVSAYRRLEGTYRLSVQELMTSEWKDPMKTAVVHSFETLGISSPAVRCDKLRRRESLKKI